MDRVLTKDEYFGDFKETYGFDFNDMIADNASVLIFRVNSILADPALARFSYHGITSGWRPRGYNALVKGAAVKSKHITAQAVDIRDDDGMLDEILLANPMLLEKYDLAMEHPSATKGWCHLQSVLPASGRRIFYP